MDTGTLPELLDPNGLLGRMADTPSFAQSLGDVIQLRQASAMNYVEYLEMIDTMLRMIEERANAL